MSEEEEKTSVEATNPDEINGTELEASTDVVAVEEKMNNDEEKQQDVVPVDAEEKTSTAEDETKLPELDIARLKREVFELINRTRNEKSVDEACIPLRFDQGLSTAADLHCKEMAEHDYASCFNLKGEKPYQRYAESGNRYQVREYMFSKDDHHIFDESPTKMEDMALSLLFDANKFCKLEGEYDATDEKFLERQEELTMSILKDFTHVGIGIEINPTHFRYIEVYTTKLLTLQTTPQLKPEGCRINGEMLINPYMPNLTPYAATLYYEQKPLPLSIEQLREMSKSDAADESLNELVCTVWPWELQIKNLEGTAEEKSQVNKVEFSFDLDLKTALDDTLQDIKEGQYFLQIFLAKDKSTVPFNAPDPDLGVPVAGEYEDIICSIGQLINYPSNETTVANPIEHICLPRTIDEVPAPGYEFESGENKTEHTLFFKRRLKNKDAAIVELAVAFGEQDIPPEFEVLCYTPQVITESSEEKEADLNNETNGESKMEETPEKVDLRSILKTQQTPPGESKEGEEKQSESKLEDESEISQPLFLCYRRSSDPVEVAARSITSIQFSREEDEDSPTFANYEQLHVIKDLKLMYMLQSSLDDIVGTNQDVADDENDGWGDIADGSAKAQEFGIEVEGEDVFLSSNDAKGKRQELEMAELAAQSARIEQMLEEAKEENTRLVSENATLQKKLVPMMNQKQQQQQKMQQQSQTSDRVSDNKESQDRISRAEQEKSYRLALKSVNDARTTLHHTQAGYDKVAMDLQTRLDEKESKALEIRDSFIQFKREIAKAAENSRTGKPIPRRIISQFEDTEIAKDEEVERVRLKNINLKTQLRKLEATLREKEQLAEGLHLIDFEQLKIENQTLNEKIEERNEELHKLRKKTTTTVQVLTHIKEKLQFVQAESTVLKGHLSEIDEDLVEERDILTKLKHQRDSSRAQMESKKQDQGLINSTALVKDYEQRKQALAALHNQLEELQERYANLMAN